MLSSQTRDEVTSAAMTRLKQHGLTPTSLVNMPDHQLGELIKPVGFWRKKIVYLKKATTLVIEKYGGDIPETVEELCKLPGVGPKMAYLTVQCAWGVNVGIGVDTHVHRSEKESNGRFCTSPGSHILIFSAGTEKGLQDITRETPSLQHVVHVVHVGCKVGGGCWRFESLVSRHLVLPPRHSSFSLFLLPPSFF